MCVCVFQSAEHDYYLTQTNMKIDTEVAGLKTMLESHKLDTIKYLAGRTVAHLDPNAQVRSESHLTC